MVFPRWKIIYICGFFCYIDLSLYFLFFKSLAIFFVFKIKVPHFYFSSQFFQLINAPSAGKGKIGEASKAKNDDEKEIEDMLAQLKAWRSLDKHNHGVRTGSASLSFSMNSSRNSYIHSLDSF